MTLYDLRTGDRVPDVPPDGPRPAADVATGLLDLHRAERALRELLVALGRDPQDEHFRDTPRRVAVAYAELLKRPYFDLTTFPNTDGYDELVLVRDIEFHSLCEHHLLPFAGVAHLGYLPGPRLLGLSKLARVVEMFSRDLQMQERMTAQIADWLDERLHPRGAAVVLEADHSCMGLRGVRKTGATTVTSALRGELRQGASRQEFLALTKVRR